MLFQSTSLQFSQKSKAILCRCRRVTENPGGMLIRYRRHPISGLTAYIRDLSRPETVLINGYPLTHRVSKDLSTALSLSWRAYSFSIQLPLVVDRVSQASETSNSRRIKGRYLHLGYHGKTAPAPLGSRSIESYLRSLVVEPWHETRKKRGSTCLVPLEFNGSGRFWFRFPRRLIFSQVINEPGAGRAS